MIYYSHVNEDNCVERNALLAQQALFYLVFNGNLQRMREENLPPSFQKAVLLLFFGITFS